MMAEEFLALMSEVDDGFLERSERDVISMKKRTSWTWLRAGALAACVCLVAAVGFALWQRTKHSQTGLIPLIGETEETSVVDENPSIVVESDNCYVAPEPGMFVCTVGVSMANEYYTDKDVRFLVELDVYKDDLTRLSEEDTAAEYKRLSELGYVFYEVDIWLHHCTGDEKHTKVMCALTEEQIENFDVNPEYGYFAKFVANVDISSIPVDEDDIITSFATWYETPDGIVSFDP